MQFVFRPMTEEYATKIANWHYEGDAAFYDMDQDPEDLEELLDPSNWIDKYRAVVSEGEDLIGFFSFGRSENTVTIGLGMKPELTGKGLGQAFVQAGMGYAQHKFGPVDLHLSVATFNKRAIKIYERLGFKRQGVFMNDTNGGIYEFLRMVKQSKTA